MRQVPHYLLIGNGRVARHFQHYFTHLQLTFSTWHRQQPVSQLERTLQHATHILLLVSDGAIAEVIESHLQHTAAMLIHFSGSVVMDHAYGAHPLMTFSDALYDLPRYQTIPFILDHDAPAFSELLPGVPNSHARLHTSLKPKYHALCVLSGNMSCLLWQKLFSAFEHEFRLPHSVAYPYLQQQMQNLLTHPVSALTGPMVRHDVATIANNITALDGDPFQAVYKSVVDCYEKVGQTMMAEISHEHI